MKKILSTLIIVLVFISSAFSVNADSGKSYIYNNKNVVNRVLEPYTTTKIIGSELNLSEPQDMVCKNGKLYILDSGNSKIKVLSASDYSLIETIQLQKNNELYSAGELTGICVHNDNLLVVDYGNKVILRTDMSGNIIKEYGNPLDEDSNLFMPRHVAVDATNHIYLCLDVESRGLMVIDQEGNYCNFFGSVSVTQTSKILINMFWRKFMTEEQIKKSEQNVPGGYNNVVSDNQGFIYAVRSATDTRAELINKLNSAGKNVLKYKGNFGDVEASQNTSFISVAVNDENMIAALDSANKHIFFYSADGELLYIFGAQSQQHGTNNSVQSGTFVSPIDIEFNGKDLLVLDKSTGYITVFNATEFGAMVQEATYLHSKAKFDEAGAIWNDVLALNSNYEKAYIGLGKIAEASGDYKEAMKNYKIGGNKTYYSSAFKKYRTKLLRDFFYYIVVLVVVIIVAIVILLKKKKNQQHISFENGGKFKYYLHTMRHPFDGFSELRYNKKFSMPTACCLLILYFFISCLNQNYNGYIFNGDSADNFNIFIVFLSTFGIVLLFSLSAWLLSTFLEGKGRLSEIFICTCYSLTPIIITSACSLILTNVLSLDEAFFATAVSTIGTILTLVYLFISNGELNQYEFKKNIASLLITVFGMLVIVFLIFLFVSLWTQVVGFVKTLISEINYRRIAAG